MKSLKFVLQRDIFLQLLVASVGLTIYLPIARLDPDPHHDGLQIATAIGVGSGRAIHQSVFSQYGPITAWLQGSWVWVTSPTLLNIRVLTALQVVLIGALMCRIFLQLRVERMIAIGVPIGWLLACPVWATGIGASFLPWSSITYGLFLLTSITTLIEWARRNDGRDKYGFASGLFIGLAIMTRTNLGVTFLIFLFASYLVLFVTTGRPSASEIRWPFVGIFSGVVVPILILLSSKSFGDFIEQTILGPLNGKSSTATSQSFLLINYIFLTLGFIALLIAIALFAKEKLDTPISKMLLVSFSFFVVIINLSDVKITSISSWTVKNFLSVQSSESSTTLISIKIVVPLTIAISCYLAIKSIFKIYAVQTKKPILSENYRRQLIVAVVVAAGLSSLAQLYPRADVYHLWLLAPAPILLVFSTVHDWSAKALRILLIPLLFVPACQNLNGLIKLEKLERRKWSGGVLDGMLIKNEYFASFERANEVLRNVTEPASFECSDGLWSVWNQRYTADSASFVNWSFGANRMNVEAAPLVVACETEDQRQSIAEKFQRIVIANTGESKLAFNSFLIDGPYKIEVSIRKN